MMISGFPSCAMYTPGGNFHQFGKYENRNQRFAHVPHKWKFQKQIFETTTCHGNSPFLHVYSGNWWPILSHLYFKPSVKPSIHLPSFSQKFPSGLMVYKSRSHWRKTHVASHVVWTPVFSRWTLKMKKGCHACIIEKPLDDICICTWDKKKQDFANTWVGWVVKLNLGERQTPRTFVLVRNAWWYPCSSSL